MTSAFENAAARANRVAARTFGRSAADGSENLSYQPAAGGDPTPVFGVFNAAHEFLSFDDGVPVSTVSPAVFVESGDLPSGCPAKNDEVTRQSVTYLVDGWEPDGLSGLVLRLKKKGS